MTILLILLAIFGGSVLLAYAAATAYRRYRDVRLGKCVEELPSKPSKPKHCGNPYAKPFPKNLEKFTDERAREELDIQGKKSYSKGDVTATIKINDVGIPEAVVKPIRTEEPLFTAEDDAFLESARKELKQQETVEVAAMTQAYIELGRTSLERHLEAVLKAYTQLLKVPLATTHPKPAPMPQGYDMSGASYKHSLAGSDMGMRIMEEEIERAVEEAVKESEKLSTQKASAEKLLADMAAFQAPPLPKLRKKVKTIKSKLKRPNRKR